MLAKLTQAALYATNTEVKEYLKTGTTIDKLSFEYPGDKCCTLYVGYDFTGEQRTFCHTEGSNYTNINLLDKGFDNTVSSWHCGKAITYEFYIDPSQSGHCETDGS